MGKTAVYEIRVMNCQRDDCEWARGARRQGVVCDDYVQYLYVCCVCRVLKLRTVCDVLLRVDTPLTVTMTTTLQDGGPP